MCLPSATCRVSITRRCFSSADAHHRSRRKPAYRTLHSIAGERGWTIHELLTLDDSIASIEVLDSLAGGSGEAGSKLPSNQTVPETRPRAGKTAIVASAAPLASSDRGVSLGDRPCGRRTGSRFRSCVP